MTTITNAKHASYEHHSSNMFQHMLCTKHPMKLLFTLVAVIVLAFLCLCGYIAYAVHSQELDYSWYLNHENDTEFTISTPGQLYALTYLVNGCAAPNNDNQTYPAVSFKDKTISIKNDIALALPGATPKNFLPIGSSAHPFEGVFNGNNHKITGYSFSYQDSSTQNASSVDSASSTSGTLAADNDIDVKAFKAHYDSSKNQWNNIGLFGYISKDAQISNLTVQGSLRININKAALSNVGGVIGCALGKLDNITSDVSVHVVNNSKASNAVPTTMTNIAGVCGFSNNTLVACKNTGNITVESSGDCIQDTTSYVLHPLLKALGGVVGFYGASPDEPHKRTLSTSIQHCSNTGVLACKFTGHAPKDRFGETVDAKPACVGGIAGYCSASIIDCKNSGNILTSIPGTNDFGYDATEGNGAMQCGGIVGNFGAIIEGSGPLSTEMKDDGGRKDARIQLQRCVNVGQVIASNQVGGIAGTAGTYTTITECNNGNDLENNNALTGEFKNPRKSAIVSTRWNKPFTAGIVGTTLGNVNLCFNRAQVNTIGIGYYVCGIVGSLGSDNQDKIEYIAKEDPTYQAEMWGCYNTGQIGADHATSYRYGALAGENNGYIHHCLVRENCVLGTEAKAPEIPADDDMTVRPSSEFVGGKNVGAISNVLAVSKSDFKSSANISMLNMYIRQSAKKNDFASLPYWYLAKHCNDEYPVLTSKMHPKNPRNINSISFEIRNLLKAPCDLTSRHLLPVPNFAAWDGDGNSLIQNADFIVVPVSQPASFKTGDKIKFKIVGIGNYTGTILDDNYVYTIGKSTLSNCSVNINKHTFNWEVQFPRISDIRVCNEAGDLIPQTAYSFVIYNSRVSSINDNGAPRYICFDSEGYIQFTDGAKECIPALNANTQGRTFDVLDSHRNKISNSDGIIFDPHSGKAVSGTYVSYYNKLSSRNDPLLVGYSCKYYGKYIVQCKGKGDFVGTLNGSYVIDSVDLVRNEDINYKKITYKDPNNQEHVWQLQRSIENNAYKPVKPIEITFTGAMIKPTISATYLKHPLNVYRIAESANGAADADRANKGHIQLVYGKLTKGTPSSDADKYANRDVLTGGAVTVCNGSGSIIDKYEYDVLQYIQFKNYLVFNFNIIPAPITDCHIAAVDKVYTGGNLNGLVSVQLHGNSLIEGKDYTVKYKNSEGVLLDNVVEKGSYTAIITPKDNLTGSVQEIPVKVVERGRQFNAETTKQLTPCYEIVKVSDYVKVTDGSNTLTKGVHYDCIVHQVSITNPENDTILKQDKENIEYLDPSIYLYRAYAIYVEIKGKGIYENCDKRVKLELEPFRLADMEPSKFTFKNLQCSWTKWKVPKVQFTCDEICYDGKPIYKYRTSYPKLLDICGSNCTELAYHTVYKKNMGICDQLVEPGSDNKVHFLYLVNEDEVLSNHDYKRYQLPEGLDIQPYNGNNGTLYDLIDAPQSPITYSGQAQDMILVRDKSKIATLPFYDFQKGRDYDVTYSDNINAGQCRYTVNFKGKYTGTYNGTFTIKPKKLDSSFTVKQDNGALSVTGPWNNPLKEDKDYQIANKSETFVVIQGIGNYTGDLKANVSIPDVTLGGGSGDTPGGGSTPAGDTPGGGSTPGGDTPGGGSTPGGNTPGGGGGSVPSSQDPTDPSGFVPFEEATKRLAGETAADTMQTIVQTAFPNPVPYAVLATNAGYWDALSANALAGSYNAPVLLTGQSALPQQTIDELVRLQVQKVFICGGENAISQDVSDQLASMGIQTERIAGQWASDTANDIAEEIVNPDNTCFITTSWGYADALSVSSYAYAHRSPILLANYNTATLDDSTLELIKRKGFVHVVVVGGTSVVSADVEQQLAQAGIADVQRIAGYTQYDTSSLLANHFLSCGLSANNFAIATGWGYEDALCGAALCGKNQSILLLADDSDFSTIDTVIADHINEIKRCYLLGGKSVVGENVVSRLKENFIRLSISYSR